MIRRKSLLLFGLITVLIFIITTNYLLLNLQTSDIEVRTFKTIEEKIYLELENLPQQYRLKSYQKDPTISLSSVIYTNRSFNLGDSSFKDLWKEANSWVSKTRIVDFSSPQIVNVLLGIKNAKITKADLDTRGTQLKLLLTLQVGLPTSLVCSMS